MSYTVNKFDGLLLATVNDGTVDTTSTSIKLIGKGVTNYGETVAENFVHMIENFARRSPPSNPQVGQLWYHIDANGVGNHVMKVCKSVSPITFIPITSVGVGSGGTGTGSGFPADPNDGDLFWDGSQLFVFDETVPQFILIGPLSNPDEATKVVHDEIEDTSSTLHNVIRMVIGIPGSPGEITTSIFSGSSTFVPAFTAEQASLGLDLTTYPQIFGGLTINQDFVDDSPFAPLDNSSEPTLDQAFDFGSLTKRWKTIFAEEIVVDIINVAGTGVSAGDFMRTDITNIPDADLTFNLGSATNRFDTIYVGNVESGFPQGRFLLPAGTTAQRPGISEDGLIRFNTTTDQFEGFSGVTWRGLGGVVDLDQDTFISAERGNDEDQLIFVTGNTPGDTATGAPVDRCKINNVGFLPIDLSLTLGEAAAPWNNVWASNINVPGKIKTTNSPVGGEFDGTWFVNGTLEATYADIAERYAVDNAVEPGDLVKIGGEAEVTKTSTANDEDVFGIISKSPAFAMNRDAGSDKTHPYIALSGRIMVKVTGPVTKGQRLVSSDIAGVAQGVTNLSSEHIFAIFGRSLETNASEGVRLIEAIVGSK